MVSAIHDSSFGDVVAVTDAPAGARVMLVCEHASNRIPETLGGLGLDASTRASHIAWDPGAEGVAIALASALQAPLVRGRISRLVYDLNRPPEAPDAVPARSEVFDIPGNTGLSPAAQQARVLNVHDPFRDCLANQINARREALALLVTVHSFTPVYRGRDRAVKLGILHHEDDRFARAMMRAKPPTAPAQTRLNEPYSRADGVTHTLAAHGAGLLSVMLEIRNDLIATPDDQGAWAAMLAPWIKRTLEGFSDRGAAA